MSRTAVKKADLIEMIGELTAPLSPFPTDVNALLKKQNGIKAVLLDIYGTLLISGTGDIGIAEEKNNEFPISGILEKNGFSLLCCNESIDERFSGLMIQYIRNDHEKMKNKGVIYPEVDIREIWEKILKSLTEESFISGFCSTEIIEKAALSYECLVNPVWPMPGADELLQHLYKSPVKIGIVSNAQFYTEPILEKLLDFRIGDDYFNRELLFYSYEERQAKPSRDFFCNAVLKMKKIYNINAEEILYIGNDMLNDVYTASECRCRTALFAGDKRSLRLRASDDRCRDLKPDLVITHLKQLIDIL